MYFVTFRHKPACSPKFLNMRMYYACFISGLNKPYKNSPITVECKAGIKGSTP